MTKLKQILFLVIVSLVVLGGASVVMAQSYFEPINLRTAGLSINLTEANSVPSYYNQSNWYPQVNPVSGNTFLVFAGNYYYDNYSNNDYAYYAWQGGEENNYNWQQIRTGDILYFSTYTDQAPGCGLSINFTDNSWLSTDYKDQDGVEAKNSNFRSEGKWYQRRVDLSNLAGKTIRNLALVQENNRYSGESFRCYFDKIEIVNNNYQTVYYNQQPAYYNTQPIYYTYTPTPNYSNQNYNYNRNTTDYRHYYDQNNRSYQAGTNGYGRYFGRHQDTRVQAVYNNPQQPVCRDSDGGNNALVSGTADNRVNGVGSYVQDTCISKDLVGYNNWQYNEKTSCYGSNCFVKEGYCNGTSVTNVMVSCAYGCQSGACLSR